MTKITSLITAFLVGSFIFVGISSAQNNEIDRQKAKIVSRIYDLTYGSEEMNKLCSPQESKRVREAVIKFKNTYPELMRLVEQSPYFDRAKKNMSELIDRMAKNQEHPDCLARLNLLQQCTDTESGRKMILDKITKLKK